MAGTRSFTDLRVWKLAHQVTLAVYRVTTGYPSGERFGLVSQMRRAAVSVPANIAEGFGRSAKKDRARFYEIAKSSAEELRYYLILSKDLRFLSEDAELQKQLDAVCAMLYRPRGSVLSDVLDAN